MANQQATNQPMMYTFENDCYAILMPLITNPDELYLKIMADVEFEQKSIKMFGKTVPLPRLTAFCAKNGLDQELEYKYSGIVNKSGAWPSYFDPIVSKLGELGSQLMPGSNIPNSCLLNYYRNGEDYIGWHSDDEMPSYMTNPIYSISLGEERSFEIRKKGAAASTRILLKNGHLLIMYGSKFQSYYQHRLPKAEDQKMKPRINLTFRYHV
jgi:alkylated DNA repair dioxygenase AlkB